MHIAVSTYERISWNYIVKVNFASYSGRILELEAEQSLRNTLRQFPNFTRLQDIILTKLQLSIVQSMLFQVCNMVILSLILWSRSISHGCIYGTCPFLLHSEVYKKSMVKEFHYSNRSFKSRILTDYAEQYVEYQWEASRRYCSNKHTALAFWESECGRLYSKSEC